MKYHEILHLHEWICRLVSRNVAFLTNLDPCRLGLPSGFTPRRHHRGWIESTSRIAMEKRLPGLWMSMASMNETYFCPLMRMQVIVSSALIQPDISDWDTSCKRGLQLFQHLTARGDGCWRNPFCRLNISNASRNNQRIYWSSILDHLLANTVRLPL